MLRLLFPRNFSQPRSPEDASNVTIYIPVVVAFNMSNESRITEVFIMYTVSHSVKV